MDASREEFSITEGDLYPCIRPTRTMSVQITHCPQTGLVLFWPGCSTCKFDTMRPTEYKLFYLNWIKATSGKCQSFWYNVNL